MEGGHHQGLGSKKWRENAGEMSEGGKNEPEAEVEAGLRDSGLEKIATQSKVGESGGNEAEAEAESSKQATGQAEDIGAKVLQTPTTGGQSVTATGATATHTEAANTTRGSRGVAVEAVNMGTGADVVLEVAVDIRRLV